MHDIPDEIDDIHHGSTQDAHGNGNGVAEVSTPSPSTGETSVAWLLLPPSQVPARWANRIVPLALVPLMPAEADEMLAGRLIVPELGREDESLARLAAQGLSAEEIAKRLHMTPRSVYRRLARLRERFSVSTSAELAARLARLGF